MLRQQFYVTGGAIAFGILVALANLRAAPAADQAAGRLPELKELLLRTEGLDTAHHEVFARVGQEVWEYSVKPDFMQAVTWETIRQTGILLPNEEEVIRWVRDHPEEAQRLMREFGGRFQQATP